MLRSRQIILHMGRRRNLELKLLTCIILWLGVAASADPTLRAQNYFLNGTAVDSGPDCYQLTTTVGNQNGSVWYANTLDLEQPFDIQFLINLGSQDPNGADGIMFVMQLEGTDALGQSGGGLGFLGFGTGFGVEFDTWQNGEYGDPVYDHIGYVSDGIVSHLGPTAYGGPVQMSAASVNTEDGVSHVGRVQWDPANQLLSTYFDCELRLVAQVDLIGQIFNGTTDVYWGFTGSTGGSFNNQTVCLQANSLVTPPDVLLCSGASVQLNVVGNPAGGFNWEPPDFLSDPTVSNPVCTPTASVSYTVTYTDLCGEAISYPISVEVADLVLSVEPEGPWVLTCDQPVIAWEVTSNFPGTDFTWWEDGVPGWAGGTGGTAVVDAPGTYGVVGTAADGACTAEWVLNVGQDTARFPVEVTASEGQIDCDTPEVVVTAVAPAGGDLTWQVSGGGVWLPPGPQGSEGVAGAAGVYGVTCENPANGCTSFDEVVIAADFTVPEVEAGSADSLTCRMPTQPIEGAYVLPEGYTPLITWTREEEAGGLLGFDGLQPTALLPGTYVLEVTFAENGCTGRDTVRVVEDPGAQLDVADLALPNVVTPNGDGRNEVLIPWLPDDPEFDVLTVLDRWQLRVYNRWGNLVYEGSGLPVAWDVRAENGERLAGGSYWAVSDFILRCGGLQTGTIRTPLQVLHEAQ
ncbi:MAG: hypothetical protein RJA19_1596 [Bacteroidota bacterium]